LALHILFDECWPCTFSILASRSIYKTFIILTSHVYLSFSACPAIWLFPSLLCSLYSASDRFCHLPSWALLHYSVIMSLSGSAWSDHHPTNVAQPNHLSPSAYSFQSLRLTPAQPSFFMTVSFDPALKHHVFPFPVLVVH